MSAREKAANCESAVDLLSNAVKHIWTTSSDKARSFLFDDADENTGGSDPCEEIVFAPILKAFEDFDMLESGFAREYISDECLLPCPNLRRWMTCNVIKEEKTVFRMFLEGASSRFLLSAKRIGPCFYISQYEAFPENVDAVPSCYYCAILRPTRRGQFKLFLNGCEACDKTHTKYTCGGSLMDRQLLAEIQHSVKRVKAANADMRCLTAKLPPVSADKRSRVVWCPRNDRLRDKNSEEAQAGSIKLLNKLPEWNEDLQSLVLRFNKGRVLAPSAKNFLMCVENQNDREGILQFGKTWRRRYALDFRYPISPLQAFGVCLSLFNWTI